MEKSEKLILEAFLEAKVPIEFASIDMGMFVADTCGFAQRLHSKGHLKLRENEREFNFRFTNEGKKEFGAFVGNSNENLLYYYLIKSCYILFKKYKK